MYQRTTSSMLEGEILIEIRNRHIKLITKQFVINNIIPHTYLDNLIKLDNIKNNVYTIDNDPQYYNNVNRINILEKIFKKECIKHTAQFIRNITSLT